MNRTRSIAGALTSALLFGASAPLAKLLLELTSPWMLAALLYGGSGMGLLMWRLLRRAPVVHLSPVEWRWFGLAVLCGGVVGPVLLMLGLSGMSAAGASLLLNAEAVLTALIAWLVFRENADRRMVLGMALIVAGAALLAGGKTWQAESGMAPLLVLLACLAWALDNNLTRKVALHDASFLAMVKGLVAGGVNLALALWLGSTWPAPATWLAGGLLGLTAYGLSLVLFIQALREMGTARTGAYFSVAPFFGAFLAIVLLHEPVTVELVAAGVLMALGVWLHVTERHAHFHTHKVLEHSHTHVHDAHHQHPHNDAETGTLQPGQDDQLRHTHPHRHGALPHAHAHWPDAHHQHSH